MYELSFKIHDSIDLSDCSDYPLIWGFTVRNAAIAIDRMGRFDVADHSCLYLDFGIL